MIELSSFSDASAVNLLESKLPWFKEPLFGAFLFKQLVMKQANLFIIIFLCIAKSKRCSVEKYEILIRVFAVDLTYMVVYTLLIPMSYLLPKTKGWNLSSCP